MEKDKKLAYLINNANFVTVKKFSGEGTGIQCKFNRPWKLGERLNFRIDAIQDKENISTYSAYLDNIFIASCQTNGNLLSKCYSFIEDIKYGTPSVHLNYSSVKTAISMTTEMTITQSASRTFFVACGFQRGYFGIQDINNAGEQPVLFSIWDIGSTCVVTGKRPEPSLTSGLVTRFATYDPSFLISGSSNNERITTAEFTSNKSDNKNIVIDGGVTDNGDEFYLSTGGTTKPSGGIIKAWPCLLQRRKGNSLQEKDFCLLS